MTGRNKPADRNRNGFEHVTIMPSMSFGSQFDKEIRKKCDDFRASPEHSLILRVMSRQERKRVHELAGIYGFTTRSFGKEPSRQTMLMKARPKMFTQNVSESSHVDLTPSMKQKIGDFIAENPIADEDIDMHLKPLLHLPNHRKTVMTNRGALLVPPEARTRNFEAVRNSLPASNHRQEILDAVRENNVVIITGSTGCGKTTQVPQYLLEDATKRNQRVRILCTQPRRLPAITIAERVARERGENVGDTVGYHIRLEQKTSQSTVLTFCTSGVLLRRLSQDPVVSGITHVILDEVHERETNTDYLLIALKLALKKRKDLKVILMSATLEGNLSLFKSYFEGVAVKIVEVKMRMFDVHRFYIDDVLAMTGHLPESIFDNLMMVSSVAENNQFPRVESWGADMQTQALTSSKSATASSAADWMNTAGRPKQQWGAPSVALPSPAPPIHQAQTMPNFQPMYSQDSSYYNSASSNPQHSSYMCVAQELANSHSTSQLQNQAYGQAQGTNAPHDGYQQQLTYYQPSQQGHNYPIHQPQHDVYDTSDQWVSGNYTTQDGELISAELMQLYKDQLGFYTAPVQGNSQQANWQPHSHSNHDYNNYQSGHQQQYDYRQRESPEFYVPNTQCETTYQQQQDPLYYPIEVPVPGRAMQSKSMTAPFGLSQFSSTDFGFHDNLMREKKKIAAYRSDIIGSLQARRPHFESVYMMNLLREHRQTTKGENLYYKYRALGGERYAGVVDPDLTADVIRYCVGSDVEGAILVFLPGYEDIMMQYEKLRNYKPQRSHITGVEVMMLHSQMNTIDQHHVFDKMPKNIRKIILSTNIAEASLTIDDVVFVIDSGKAKEKVYDHNVKFSQLKVTSISKSSAEQRAGRAGRCRVGYCFRLYSEEEFEAMPSNQTPEMQRSAIHDICLHAKMFAPEKMRVAMFLSHAPEPPSAEAIEQSLEFLEQIGALYSADKNVDITTLSRKDNEPNGDPELTNLGRTIAQLPLEPHLARLLLFGVALKCLTPVVNLVAVLSCRDPFFIPTADDRDKAYSSRAAFSDGDFSDHLMLIRIVDEFCKLNGRSECLHFCSINYLNHSSMRMIQGVRKQLLTELSRVKMIDVDGDPLKALQYEQYNLYSECWPMVQGAIVAGLYPCVGAIRNQNKLKKIQTFVADQHAIAHPSSVVKRHVADIVRQRNEVDSGEPVMQYLVFTELAKIDAGLSVRGITIVPPIAVVLFVGAIRLKESVFTEFGLYQGEFADDGDPATEDEKYTKETYQIEPWFSASGLKQDLKLLLQLRFKFMCYFIEALSDPWMFSSNDGDHMKMLATLKSVLEEEHRRCRFPPAKMPKLGKLLHKEDKKPAPLQNVAEMFEKLGIKPSAQSHNQNGGSVRQNHGRTYETEGYRPHQHHQHQHQTSYQQKPQNAPIGRSFDLANGRPPTSYVRRNDFQQESHPFDQPRDYGHDDDRSTHGRNLNERNGAFGVGGSSNGRHRQSNRIDEEPLEQRDNWSANDNDYDRRGQEPAQFEHQNRNPRRNIGFSDPPHQHHNQNQHHQQQGHQQEYNEFKGHKSQNQKTSKPALKGSKANLSYHNEGGKSFPGDRILPSTSSGGNRNSMARVGSGEPVPIRTIRGGKPRSRDDDVVPEDPNPRWDSRDTRKPARDAMVYRGHQKEPNDRSRDNQQPPRNREQRCESGAFEQQNRRAPNNGNFSQEQEPCPQGSNHSHSRRGPLSQNGFDDFGGRSRNDGDQRHSQGRQHQSQSESGRSQQSRHRNKGENQHAHAPNDENLPGSRNGARGNRSKTFKAKRGSQNNGHQHRE